MSSTPDCCEHSKLVQEVSWKEAIHKRIVKAPGKIVQWAHDIRRQFRAWIFSKDFIALCIVIGTALAISLLRGYRYEDFAEYALMFKGNWKSRVYTMGLVLAFFGVHHVWMLPIVDILMLVGPKGDALTVGGRHVGGDQTWFLVKRAHAIGFHLAHYIIVILVARMMRRRNPLQLTTASRFMTYLSQLTHMRGLRVKSERVLTSTVSLVNMVVFSYFFFATLREAQLPFPQCISEKNRDLAVVLHQFYVWSSALQLLWSVVVMLAKSAPTWKSCFETYPVTYWFWGIVLYYCPADDIWLPMAMECVRVVFTAYCRMFNLDLPMVGPITATVEILHFIASASGLCPFPKVLWLRLPNLASAVRGLLNDVVRRLSWGRAYTSFSQLGKILVSGAFNVVEKSELEVVTIYTLLQHPQLADVKQPTKSMRLPPQKDEAINSGRVVEPLTLNRNIFGETIIPGQWLAFQAPCIFGDHQVTVEKAGQFKVLHPLLDITGRLRRAVFGPGSNRYLAKRYHKSPGDMSVLPTEVEKNRIVRNYFDDVLMQELTAYYANKYSENDVPCKVEMVKACVVERNSVLVSGGGEEQNNSFDVRYVDESGAEVIKSAVMSPNRYRTRELFAAEIQRALTEMGTPLKFTVSTKDDHTCGPFSHRIVISSDRKFELVFYDGPSGVASERCAELMGYDSFMDYRDATSYTSQVPTRGFYLLERCMDGCYTKYNNNSFWPLKIDMGAGRNTPNAFTHFTYQFTNRRLLVCDIQGVGDYYTDPQIHTEDPELRKFVYNTPGFWNHGQGVLAVLLSHKDNCASNEICQDLKLTDYWWEGELPQRTVEEITEIAERNHRAAHEAAENRRKHGFKPDNTGVNFRMTVA